MELLLTNSTAKRDFIVSPILSLIKSSIALEHETDDDANSATEQGCVHVIVHYKRSTMTISY